MQYCPIDAIVSSSMGILAASATAGGASDEASIKFIISTSGAFESFSPKGAMIVVLSGLESFKQNKVLRECCQIAGVNFERAYIISLLESDLSAVKLALAQDNLLYQQLPVRYPYHSSWLNPSRELMIDAIHNNNLCAHPLRLPLCCSSQVNKIIRHLEPEDYWHAFSLPMQHLEMVKIQESYGETNYIDCSPSGTMANIVKYASDRSTTSTCHTLLSPFQTNSMATLDKIVEMTNAKV
jgi:malonyl CoA-acyl carrier protein transacylase